MAAEAVEPPILKGRPSEEEPKQTKMTPAEVASLIGPGRYLNALGFASFLPELAFLILSAPEMSRCATYDYSMAAPMSFADPLMYIIS